MGYGKNTNVIQLPAKRLDGDKPDSIDLIYARELRDSPDFSVDFDSDDAYRWNGDFWEAQKVADERRRAAGWLERHSPSTISDKQAFAVASLAKTMAVTIPDADPKKVIIPLKGAYLHLERSEDGTHGFRVKRPERSDGVTYGINATSTQRAESLWVPNGDISGSRLGRFLEQVLPNPEVRSVVQEFFGVTLLPDARHHKALCLIGRGRNGKGTLARLLKRLHRCPIAVDANRLTRFSLEGAESASLVIADEVKERGLASQELKKCISGEPIQVDRKGRKVITVELKAKWLLMTNHVPKLDDMTLGMMSRFIFVPMETTIDGKSIVVNLDEELADHELDLFVQWCLAGLLRVSNRGRLPVDDELPEPCRLLKDTVKKASCSILEWLDDMDPIKVDNTVLTPKQDIWKAYASWAEDKGYTPFSDKTFWDRLTQYLSLPNNFDVRRRTQDGKRLRFVPLVVPGVSSERFGTTDF